MGTISRLKAFRRFFISLRSFISLLSKKPSVVAQEFIFAFTRPSVAGLLTFLGICLAVIPLTDNILIRGAAIALVAITAVLAFREAVMRRTDLTIYSPLPRFRNRIEVIPLHWQGRLKGGLYDWKESTRLYQAALNLSPRSDLYGIILHDMGGSYVWPGRKKESLEAFDNAFTAYRDKDNIRDELGIARVHIARMNAYVYFGDCSLSFEGELGKAEEDFIAGMKICSVHDPILKYGNGAYSHSIPEVEQLIQEMKVPDLLFDPYGASKAHCQYAWALLEDCTAEALWHARVAYAYARRINDFQSDTLWGWRDGVVGSTWRESLALFTIGDCYTIMRDMNSARDFYSKNEAAIPFTERKWYFQGHYYWYFLCMENKVSQARKLLTETREVAEQDDYVWRVAVTHLHFGELEDYFANPRDRGRVRKEYETAVTTAKSGQFELLYLRSQRKLNNFIDREAFYP